MKVYAQSIGGEIKAWYSTAVQAQKCVDSLNSVFDQRRRRHGLDFDTRVAIVEEYEVGVPVPEPTGPISHRWFVTFEIVGGLQGQWVALTEEYPTREQARQMCRHARNNPFYRNARIERVTYQEIKREVVR